LYRLKPAPAQLTAFYLMIAAGGALGSLFVALAAPKLFTSLYEIHYGLVLCAFLFCVSRFRSAGNLGDKHWRWLAIGLTALAFAGLDFGLTSSANVYKTLKPYVLGIRIGTWALFAVLLFPWIIRKQFSQFRHWKFLACTWLSLGCVALGTILWAEGRRPSREIVYKSRNFYGMLTVFEQRKDEPKEHRFLLQHGRITHGLQFTDKSQATWATSYYGENSGIGLGMATLPVSPRRIGVVGLGTGTITVYGRVGDYFRIYEINPDVCRLATACFTYLTNCLGKVEVIRGDARLSMENEPPQNFDMIALDAFSSDSIPVHLLTREAFLLYARHLKPRGIIAVHISNHYLDLEPVVAKMAREFNYKYSTIDYDELEGDWWLYGCTWMLLSHAEEIFNNPPLCWASSSKTNLLKAPLWTDDFASLFPLLR
jgi:hypothetical protein